MKDPTDRDIMVATLFLIVVTITALVIQNTDFTEEQDALYVAFIMVTGLAAAYRFGKGS